MALFKTDPLLAFCRLLAWFILLAAAGGGLVSLGAALATLFNGDFVVNMLLMSYPQLDRSGLLPVFGVAMAFIAIGLVLVVRFMTRLLAIIRSVAAGEAFSLTNAGRIRAMAWISLVGMPVGFCIAAPLDRVVDLLGPRSPEAGLRIEPFDAGFTYSQILLTLLLFVLARLFAQAAAMRDEIEATV